MGLVFTFWRATSLFLLLACAMKAEAFLANHPASKTSRNQPLNLVATSSSESKQTPLWTLEELEEYSEQTVGVVISFTTWGPGYRAVARAKHDESLILGYMEGFVRPVGQILHLDKMEVFKPMVKKAKRQAPDAFNFGGISFGVGLLLGYRCLLHGMYMRNMSGFFYYYYLRMSLSNRPHSTGKWLHGWRVFGH
jgi:hypothetical protein